MRASAESAPTLTGSPINLRCRGAATALVAPDDRRSARQDGCGVVRAALLISPGKILAITP